MTLLFDMVVATSGILLASLFLAGLCRTTSAALRHLILAIGIVAALAVPLTRSVVPAWRLPVAGWWSASQAIDRAGPQALLPSSTAVGPDTSTPTTSHEPGESMRWLLMRIWWAGVALALLRLITGLLRLAWLASAADDVRQPDWIGAAADVAIEYGVFRPVALLLSDHPSLLVTWGVARPRIVLPAGAGSWSAERIQIVLRHEFAHVRRGDWAVHMAAELLRAVYWFNPLSWIACRRLRQESEQACDDLVLGSGVQASDYAAHLVDLARAALDHRTIPPPALAIARPSSLERRIRAMLRADISRNPIGPRTGIVAAIAGLCLVAPVAGFTTSSASAASARASSRTVTPPTKLIRQSVLDRRRPVDSRDRDARLGVVSGNTLAVSGSTLAQAFATVFGALVDPHGGLLPAVTVTLRNGQSGAKYEVRSDRSGRFEFVGLLAGDYELEFRLPGFETVHRTISLGAGMIAEFNQVLQIGSITETVMVSDTDAPGVSGGARPAGDRPERTCNPVPVAGGIGGNIKPPLAIQHVRPVYPASARGAKVEGTVVLQGRIDTSGFVTELRALRSPDADLGAAALEAVGAWRFDATLLNCQPIETSITVMVNFSLGK